MSEIVDMPSLQQLPCPECSKVLRKRNLWDHLRNVHDRNEEDVVQVRQDLNRGLSVICPLCEERFVSRDKLAQHCQAKHSESDASQDYSVFSLTFDSEHEYEVGHALPLPVIKPSTDFNDLQQWFEEKCESMRTSLSVLRSSTVGATTTRYFV